MATVLRCHPVESRRRPTSCWSPTDLFSWFPGWSPDGPRVETGMSGRARACEGVRGRARACEGMRGRARACEGVRGHARACEGMRGHAKACEGMRRHAKACEGWNRGQSAQGPANHFLSTSVELAVFRQNQVAPEDGSPRMTTPRLKPATAARCASRSLSKSGSTFGAFSSANANPMDRMTARSI